MSEAVLDGHPDRFCDQLADALIAEAYAVDPEAYGQIEVSAWSDLVWFSGATFLTGDPTRWTHHVNDQCVVHGWAGCDERTAFLPPEHFLVQTLREALVLAMRGGELDRQGPDGKLLVRIREDAAGWTLEHVLVTVQHTEDLSVLDLAERVDAVLSGAFCGVRSADSRWTRPWEDVRLLVNPNGPLLNGGSDGDNGQTGRKLVVDFYGPRVPIGGGALSGKDLTHIDRAGAYAAREAAVRAIRAGARECLVTLCYAPGQSDPLDVRYAADGPVDPLPADWFSHPAVRGRYLGRVDVAPLGRGRHFVEPGLPWNRG
jgi:S-adenosylmethionine synthetase